jgi:uncharacterized protein YqhQ
MAVKEDDEEDVSFSGPVAWGSIAVSLALATVIFFLLPSAAAKYLEGPVGLGHLTSAMVEGAIRLALFVGYLVAIGFMPDIRRVFAYHGAEHKTINAYEAGEPLVPEAVSRYSTAHTRCGTTFLLDVLVLSIFLFAPLHFDSILLRLLSRLVLVPVVASLAYEVIRFSTERQGNPLMWWVVIKPGLTLQSLTTREPDLEMLEVGIAALKPVLEADGMASPQPRDESVALALSET